MPNRLLGLMGSQPPAPVRPARPPSPEKEMWKSIHQFDTQESGELPLEKDEEVEVLNQDASGGLYLLKDNIN